MKEVIQKAGVLVEALPYIQRFRNAIVVIKCGGSVMEDEDTVAKALADVTFMECVGMRPVLVHGGGKAISRGVAAAGIETTFLQGHRVTCEKTIGVVERVIRDEVNPQIVDALRHKGASAETVHGESIMHVTRKADVDPATGEALDWGFVGEPGEIDVAPIQAMMEREVIPVITPLGSGADEKVHNVNADVAAAAIAKALTARKLVFLSDVPGLMRDPEDVESLIDTLTLDQVQPLMDDGTIQGGMLPKVASGVAALRAGVQQVHLVDGRMPHSLLLEIFTDKGVGTQIVPTVKEKDA